MERGEKAAKLIEDPILAECFDTVEKQIYHMFRSAKLGDDDAVMKAKMLEYSLSLVKRALHDVLKTGQVAAHKFEEHQKGSSGVLGEFWSSRKNR